MLHFASQNSSVLAAHLCPLPAAASQSSVWSAALTGSPYTCSQTCDASRAHPTAHSLQSSSRDPNKHPNKQPKSSGCYTPSITSSHMAAGKTPLMMHFRVLGKKIFLSLKSAHSTPSPASLLQATHGEMGLWGVWVPSLIILGVQTSLSGSAHPACALSNGRRSHTVLQWLQNRRASTGTCAGLHFVPTYTSQNYSLLCEFQSQPPVLCWAGQSCPEPQALFLCCLWLLC